MVSKKNLRFQLSKKSGNVHIKLRSPLGESIRNIKEIENIYVM